MSTPDSQQQPEQALQKAFQQIEHILKLLEDNKDKLPNVAPWVNEELARIDGEIARFKKAAEVQIPQYDEESKKALQQILRTLPSQELTPLLATITTAEDLKHKTREVQKKYEQVPMPTEQKTQGQSPLNLLKNKDKDKKSLSEKERLEEMERRRKFGRVGGGRKNWRPM
jgi:hypothetical protein